MHELIGPQRHGATFPDGVGLLLHPEQIGDLFLREAFLLASASSSCNSSTLAATRPSARPAKIALPRRLYPDKLRDVSLPAHRRFLPLAAAWLLVLACVLAAPRRAAAVMTTPPAKLASWGLDQSASGRRNEQSSATHDRIRVNESCGYELASGSL